MFDKGVQVNTYKQRAQVLKQFIELTTINEQKKMYAMNCNRNAAELFRTLTKLFACIKEQSVCSKNCARKYFPKDIGLTKIADNIISDPESFDIISNSFIFDELSLCFDDNCDGVRHTELLQLGKLLN